MAVIINEILCRRSLTISFKAAKYTKITFVLVLKMLVCFPPSKAKMKVNSMSVTLFVDEETGKRGVLEQIRIFNDKVDRVSNEGRHLTVDVKTGKHRAYKHKEIKRGTTETGGE